jgi:hypothetical protein
MNELLNYTHHIAGWVLLIGLLGHFVMGILVGIIYQKNKDK